MISFGAFEALEHGKNSTEPILRDGPMKVTYYSDSQCQSIGGGPPGLLENPTTFNVGECKKFLSNGYAVKALSCTPGGTSTSQTYPQGCDGPPGDTYSVDEGRCGSQNGIFFITKC
jgi:hypothetical protein